MRTRLLVLSFVMLTVVAVSATVVLGADMFSGTWKANVAKSKYSPGPPPKSNILKFEAVDNGMKVVIDGVNATGQKTHTEYTVKFDGKDYADKVMLDGKLDPNGADMISAKKTDDFTFETTTKLKGKVLIVSKTVISKDGKTRTTTQTGTNAQGQTVNNTLVAEKQ
jgi:hypothetical protein